MLRPLAIAFLLVAFPTTIMLAILTPIGQVPDEPSHLGRATGLTEGHFIGHRDMVTGPEGKPVLISGVLGDPAPIAIATLLPSDVKVPPTMGFVPYYTARAYKWAQKPMFLGLGEIAIYFPVFYAPGAIGLGAAKLLGATPFQAIMTGRLANALCFMAFALAALQIARRGRKVMFCVLTCPMCLALAGSFNQDSLLIACCVLAVALTTRDGPHDRVLAAVLIGCVAIVKLPYLPLALMLLAPLPISGVWRFERAALVRRAGLIAVVSVPALAWTAWMMATVATPTMWPAYTPGPLWPGDPAQVFDRTDMAAQIAVFLADPSRLLTLPVSSFLDNPWLFWQAIGVLGWLNLVLPNVLYSIWIVAGVSAVAGDVLAAEDRGPRGSESLLFVAPVLLCMWLIPLSQYLTWSHVGADQIAGPQGRYFLPLVPLLALALPRLRVPGVRQSVARWAGAACALGPVAAVCAGAILLPQVIVAAYYVH